MKNDNDDLIPMSNITDATIIDHTKQLFEDAFEEDGEITGEHLLLADVQKIPCLVEPFLQQVGLACLAGSSDTGKSSLLRQLAISVVTGEKEFLGFPINARFKS